MGDLKDLKLGCDVATRTIKLLRGKLTPSMATEGRNKLEYDVLGLAMDALRVTKLLLMRHPDVGMPVTDLEAIEVKARSIKEAMATREREYQTVGRFNV